MYCTCGSWLGGVAAAAVGGLGTAEASAQVEAERLTAGERGIPGRSGVRGLSPGNTSWGAGVRYWTGVRPRPVGLRGIGPLRLECGGARKRVGEQFRERLIGRLI
jgi:hypothetical protein